jgi:site-specific DNA-methyltransferase (adenine-specific)
MTQTFLSSTLSVWEVAPASATRVGHPEPFPLELPRRVIELYTYRDEWVLDPFMVSGTTAVADPGCCELARRRVAAAEGMRFP